MNNMYRSSKSIKIKTDGPCIGAVVVLYNPSEREIRNINKYKDSVFFTVIVDNSSISHCDLVRQIVSNDSNVLYYSESKNLGLCKGLNIGIRFLEEKGCKWVIVFDADSELETDIVSVYKKAIKDYCDSASEIAVFSPVHLFERSSKHAYYGYKDIEWAMTSGCLFNCDIFAKQNGFMEDLFVDGLDIDYCLKSHKNGYRVIECGEAAINHHPAETRTFLGLKYGIASPYRYYMQARALIWCWKKYRNNKILLIYLGKWGKVIFLFPDKRNYISNMLAGTKDGCALLADKKTKHRAVH